MPRKSFAPEQIISKLREIEVYVGQGMSTTEACRKAQISEPSFYRWRKEYGGMQVDQAKRLKELEKENARLKRLLADAELDKSMLKEVVRGNF